MDKKIGLEHTIRNVVSESIGVSGTDKYQGTPRAFLKPAPLISPKKGDEHPNGSATLAQRGRAKITSSETMGVREEKIGLEHTIRNVLEGVGALVTGITKGGQLLYKYGDDVIDALKKAPVEKKPGLPYKEPPKKIELPPLEPAKPPVAPTVPARPNVPPSAPPASVPGRPNTPPATVPGRPNTNKPELPTNPPGKLPEPNKAPDDAVKPQVPNLPKTDRPNRLDKKADDKNKAKDKGKDKGKDKNKDKNKDKKKDKKDRWQMPPLGLGLPSITPDPVTGLSDYVPADIMVHMAQKRRVYEETDAEVIKKKTRKAQIIRKIIDEAKNKKAKNTETVNLHPKLKTQEPDENQ
jgi:hypothetical protein